MQGKNYDKWSGLKKLTDREFRMYVVGWLNGTISTIIGVLVGSLLMRIFIVS